MPIFVLVLIFCANLACGGAPCKPPTFPVAPVILPEPAECPPELTCFTSEDARALGLWLRDLSRWRIAVEACNG